jgi:AraC-like DNA-binding protein
MNTRRSFTAEVERTTTAFVRAGATTRIEDVAAALYVSRATLQRRLAREGESFTEIRKRSRVTVAIAELTHAASCAGAAARVGLSGEHLCRLVSQRTGLRPKEIVRASSLAARAQRWRRSTPPRSGSRLYWERSRRWRALEAEVRMLLAPVPAAGHPLSSWARRTIQMCARPDYRTGRYRARVHAARSAERRAREAERERFDRWWKELERTYLEPEQDLFIVARVERNIAETLTASDQAREDAPRGAPG